MSRYVQKGLTLVELLVALALSAAIITGIIQVFLSNRAAYNLTESLVRVQENGRFALDFISDALRSSGNYGCIPDLESDRNSIRSFISTTTFSDLKTIQTKADDSIGSTSDGAAIDGGFDKPDSIAILVPTDNTARVKGLLTTAPPTLSVNGGKFAPNQYVLVSNCQVADFIQLGSESNEQKIVDATSSLRTDFFQLGNLVSEVTEVNVVRYWVNTANNTLNATHYIYPASGVATQTDVLINGVENMQIEYGVDLNGDDVPDYYDRITDVKTQGNEDNIIAVKIYVLAVSGSEGESQNVVTKVQTLALGQDQGTTSDLRLRKVFESTVLLRNRVN